MPPLFFQPRYEIFARNHVRLFARPDPVEAQGKFDRRIRRGTRVHQIQLGCQLALYTTFVAAAVSFFADYLGVLSPIASALKFVAALSSTLGIVLLVAILACRRYLSLLDIELYFYSMETRLAPVGTVGPTLPPTRGLHRGSIETK